jgi:hypothetical protein
MGHGAGVQKGKEVWKCEGKEEESGHYLLVGPQPAEGL